MDVSLCRATTGRDLDWPSFAALAGGAGYDAVDIDMESARQAGAPATLELLHRNKLRPGCCGVPTEFRKDEATFEAGMKELPSYAQLAAELGSPRMATWVPPAWPMTKDEMRPILKRRFSEMGRVLADEGVLLGLEFITPLHLRQTGHPCVWQMADMLELARECGHNVGLLLDCWHWHHDPDHSVQAILDAGSARIVAVHLNDAADQRPEDVRDNQRMLPGEGVIDLKGFIGALRQIHYAGPVTLEIFGRLDQLPSEEAARVAIQAARRVFA